jgi:hypothetical protein
LIPTLSVNNYHVIFELDDNTQRRDIWFGEDMAGEGRKRSEWNLYLMTDVIGPLYAQLLRAAALMVRTNPPSFELCNYYSLWPEGPPHTQKPWLLVVREVMRLVTDFDVLWTDAAGGMWVRPSAAVIQIKSASSGGASAGAASDGSADAHALALRKILVEERISLVDAPENLKQLLVQARECFCVCSLRDPLIACAFKYCFYLTFIYCACRNRYNGCVPSFSSGAF